MASRRYLVTVNGKTRDVEVKGRTENALSLLVDGESHEVSISTPQVSLSRERGPLSSVVSSVQKPTAQGAALLDPNILSAPMPGLVVSISVSVGQTVKAGEQVMTLEAMKMENGVNAPRDGTVKAISVEEGQQVEAGSTLLELE